MRQFTFAATQFAMAPERDATIARAEAMDSGPGLQHLRSLARDLGVVLPLSFFERAGQAHFNSLAMIDADGAVPGLYRKTHIPPTRAMTAPATGGG